MRALQVRLLGPIEFAVDGVARPVTGLRRKAILAALGLQRGIVLSADRLIEMAWHDSAPATATNTLQQNISYLRRVVGDRDAIVSRSQGYVLDIAELTDAEIAEQHVERAAAATDTTVRAELLKSALRLWRGPALADVAALPGLAPQAHRLENLRARVEHELVETRLALGEHIQVLPELSKRAAERPFDERVHGQLVLALYRAGRPADALEVVRRIRIALRDELGVDPGPELRELEAAVLRHDVEPVVVPPQRMRATGLPAQLPASAFGFAGRAVELATLDATVSHNVTTAVVSGSAGVGKTTLAVHWAQRNAGRFPDGQLYVNMRGFDPGGAALEPTDALRGFFSGLGVLPERVPSGLPEQIGLYRSLLAGRRMLVVLDNARDAAQVRPLLPGAPGSLAIVTSRDRLLPLIATEGARPVTLEVLSTSEARDLLANRLGRARVDNEPEAVDVIIERCARLPLALAIAAASVAATPALTLAVLAAELVRASNRLDLLDAGDPASDVRDVFSWSYRTLSPEAARLFRLIGLHPGADISDAALVSLSGQDAQTTARAVAELVEAHLLTEHVRGRFAFHDLLCAYAGEQSELTDDRDARRRARHRLYEHYVRSAQSATLQLLPRWNQVPADSSEPGVEAEEIADTGAALAWFQAEYGNLNGLIEQAAEIGAHRHAWQLTWVFAGYLLRRGYHDENELLQVGLRAARRLPDPVGEERILRVMGLTASRWGRTDDAEQHLAYALKVGVARGDYAAQGEAYIGLSEIALNRDDPELALIHTRRSLDLYRISGDEPGTANALNSVGWCLMMVGDLQAALEHCTEALEMQQQLGERDGECATWDSLGHIHQKLGNYPEAIRGFQQALILLRETGARYFEAETLVSLGDVEETSGNIAAARNAWRQALRIFDEFDRSHGDDTRERLERTATRTRTA